MYRFKLGSIFTYSLMHYQIYKFVRKPFFIQNVEHPEIHDYYTARNREGGKFLTAKIVQRPVTKLHDVPFIDAFLSIHGTPELPQDFTREVLIPLTPEGFGMLAPLRTLYHFKNDLDIANREKLYKIFYEIGHQRGQTKFIKRGLDLKQLRSDYEKEIGFGPELAKFSYREIDLYAAETFEKRAPEPKVEFENGRYVLKRCI